MRKYTFFSDPHIGTKRTAHTTRESSKRLSEALTEAGVRLSKLPNAICGGDLFDTSFNSEADVVNGFLVASNCLAVLSGNHDETNREGTVTSLKLLEDVGCPIVRSKDLSSPHFDIIDDTIYMVPHHASQELFEEALEQCISHRSKYSTSKPAVMVLHCNYDAPFATDDSTLNLTSEDAEVLLDSFDYVFLGHEHTPKQFYDGRLVLMGNTHPTSFSDISDKYYYKVTIGEEIKVEKVKVWDVAEGFKEITFGEATPDLTGVSFVDVVGLAGDATTVDVAKLIAELRDEYPQLLAIRNSVKFSDHLDSVEIVSVADQKDIPEQIADDLKGTPMQALFTELLAEVTA